MAPKRNKRARNRVNPVRNPVAQAANQVVVAGVGAALQIQMIAIQATDSLEWHLGYEHDIVNAIFKQVITSAEVGHTWTDAERMQHNLVRKQHCMIGGVICLLSHPANNQAHYRRKAESPSSQPWYQSLNYLEFWAILSPDATVAFSSAAPQNANLT
ncbi:hypothetical protein CALCODRAFT_545223 [Calocera cornea HHB12733]|uniref:Uncharacterized protein n=1 Tax=Calocera cornea HHB12733 TaxID=1353952 RepID=A0A165EXV3_9BASI|nr:hypothetical protein CALCODRAFT_545223 [Calocera cornea HHB12733]